MGEEAASPINPEKGHTDKCKINVLTILLYVDRW